MTRAVLRKELATLWASPLPYVAGSAFHVVFGLLVVNQLDVRDQAVLQPTVPIAGFLLLFAVPIVAMRSFAEEWRSGSLEVLLAARVAPVALVVGKWLAVWVTALVVLMPIGVTVGLVALWGEPDLGAIAAGATGLMLLSATVASIGVLASALTASQPTAAAGATFAVVVSWLAPSGASALQTGAALRALSLSDRLQIFADGGLDTGDAAFFLGAASVGLAAACAVVDLRRLR